MYYSKGLLSLAMMIAIGTMSSVMSHAAPMRAGQPMVEELAHVMDVAAEQELTYEEMASSKHLAISIMLDEHNNIIMLT